MNVHELSKRYGMSNKEMREFLKLNFVDINAEGEFVKNVKRDWFIDEKAVPIIDAILNYNPPAPENEANDSSSNNSSDIKTPVMVPSEMLEKAKAKNEQLLNEINRITTAYEKLTAEYGQLQNNFLSLQEGKDSMNSAMIRKYQLSSEKLTTELNNMRKRCESLQESKEKQYEEMQTRINEMQEELFEKTEIMKQKLASDHKALEAKKLCDRLHRQLSESERNVDKLTAKLQKAELEYEALSSKMAEFKNQASLVYKTMLSAQMQLESITTNEEELLPEISSMTSSETSNEVTEEKPAMEEISATEKAKDKADVESSVPVTAQKDDVAYVPEKKEPVKAPIKSNAPTESKLVIRHPGREYATRTGKEKLSQKQIDALNALKEENELTAKILEEEKEQGVFQTVRQRIASFIGFM